MRDAAVGLRWTIGQGAWNCLRSVLARACGSSAVGLSANGYHSAGGHKISPSSSLTSEKPRGFSDELIFPSFSLPPRCGLLWPYLPFRRQHDRALAHTRPCPHGARDDAYRPIGRPCARGGLPEGRGARGRGDGHNGRKGRGLPAPPRVGLKPVVADQMTISRRKTIRAVIMRTIIDGTTDMRGVPPVGCCSQRQV